MYWWFVSIETIYECIRIVNEHHVIPKQINGTGIFILAMPCKITHLKNVSCIDRCILRFNSDVIPQVLKIIFWSAKILL